MNKTILLILVSINLIHAQEQVHLSEITIGHQLQRDLVGIKLSGNHNTGGRIELGGMSLNPSSANYKKSNIVLEANDQPNEGGKIYLRDYNGNQTIILDSNENNGSEIQGACIKVKKRNGTTGIELDADYGNNGTSRVRTDELEIRGGSDISEKFDVASADHMEILPGMIVSIDPVKTGKLSITDEPYDKKIAGVISGANGIKTGFYMGQNGSIADGEYPIALTGRVYVFTNTEGGEIIPGDMLTSSSIPGEAMKAKDLSIAQGAIIGKAMSKIDDKGFVLVLVNLQ